MPDPSANPGPVPVEAFHAERTRGADGTDYWNLTCVCGKRLLAPADVPHKQGRCPHCGARLLFPSRERHGTAGPLPIIPARRDAPRKIDAPTPASSDAEPPFSRARHDSSARIKPGHSAADTAAEKLRPKRAASARSAGLVSAWPAAENSSRLLAAFIDMTLVAAALALMLVMRTVLPAVLSSGLFMVLFLLLAHEFNDGILQILGRGSLGRRVALVVLKDDSGADLAPGKALLRPVLKLLLWPGYALCFMDENKRALHDRILGTRVLKGRAQR